MPAIQLLSASKYHEKHAGYLAVQLLLAENHEMIPLIVNCVQEDLGSRMDAVQCLALSTIANIGGKEITETLAPLVLKLLLATASPTVVKKKAALAYLRLFRKNKGIFTLDPSLPEKLTTLLDDKGEHATVLSLPLPFLRCCC
jgi:AP-2 complex subunit alpha